VKVIEIATHNATEFLDITTLVQKAIAENGFRDGLCHLFVPHTTAAIISNENEPNLLRDLSLQLERLVPTRGGYHHPDGNAYAHIKASILGPSLSIFVKDGKLQLGTWQSIFFCEFDGPRSRRLYLRLQPLGTEL